MSDKPTISLPSKPIHIEPILFCTNSDSIVLGSNFKTYIDSVLRYLKSNKELIITASQTFSESKINTGLALAQRRANALKALFRSLVNNINISTQIETEDSNYVRKDSCYKAYELKIKDQEKLLLLKQKVIIFHSYNSVDQLNELELTSVLDSLLRLLNKKEIKLKITGYTDDDGTEEEKMQLSKERALSIKKYFISKGANMSSVIVEYKGDKDPMESNETEFGRSRNRRTEILIIK